MIKLARNLTVLAAAISLSGCLKVDDNGNKKVAEALNNQNQILQQQADQAAQEKTSLSISGYIKDVSANAAADATVKIKIGSTFSDAVPTNKGIFQFDNVALGSDFELVVHSPSGAFMDRTIYGTTREGNSPGKIYQDLGEIDVAAGVEHKFKFKNAVTTAGITGLSLYANSAFGVGSGYEQYLHKSTYDEATQEYKITVPDALGVRIYANLDLNNDGKQDYRSENNSLGNQIIEVTDMDERLPIYLVDLNANTKVKLRISVLDLGVQPTSAASISIKDHLNGEITGAYDASSKQYVIDALMDSSLTVYIPAFTQNGVSYNSSTVQINKLKLDGTSFSATVITNINPNTYYNSSFSFSADADKVLDVAVRPAQVVSSLYVAGASSVTNLDSTSFNVFYSGSIELKPNSVSLLKRNVLQVVHGNDSATDDVVAGVTKVDLVDQPVDIDVKTSLGNTLLTATTKAPLEPGYSYYFDVGTIKDTSANADANLYADNVSLNVPSTNTFDINSIKLDNNNYYSFGTLIKPANTAGVSSYVYYWNNSASIYLPTSIESLKSLSLTTLQVVSNGSTSGSSYGYNIVENGVINYSKAYLVSVANNESLIGGGTGSVTRGTGLPDGTYYSAYTYNYLNDNDSVNTNSITFSYFYETKDGKQASGTITLPVQ